MDKNSSPWTKFDPLTTVASFEFTTSCLDITKFVAYHKS